MKKLILTFLTLFHCPLILPANILTRKTTLTLPPKKESQKIQQQAQQKPNQTIITEKQTPFLTALQDRKALKPLKENLAKIGNEHKIHPDIMLMLNELLTASFNNGFDEAIKHTGRYLQQGLNVMAESLKHKA